MLIITSKLPWRRQPTTPVKVNWAHPLAKDLSIYALTANAGVINLVSESVIETSRSSVSPIAIGNEIVLNKTANAGKIVLDKNYFSSISKFSIFCRLSLSTGTDLWVFSGTTSRTFLGFTSSLGAGLYARVDIALGTAYGYNTDVTQNDFSTYSMVFDGTLTGNENRLKAFKSAQQLSLSYTGTIPTSTNSTTTTEMAVGTTGTGFVGGPPILWYRALDVNELLALEENPYQMLAPTYSRRYFIPLAGGGPQTIALTTGSETGLGYALSITQPRSIAFTSGQGTGVGYQLGLVQPRTIGLVDGQETGIGYALGTTQPRVIGLTAGSETGIGYELGVSTGAGRTLELTAGAESGVGYALGLSQPRSTAFVDGQETAIGYSLGVTQPRIIGLTEGSETGVGYAMGVSTGAGRTIDLATGSETGVGYSFGVIQPRTIGFATGSETGIGYALTITPPGPVLGVVAGTETGMGYALGVIQHGRKYRYPRSTKAIHTRHYTSRL